MSRPHIEFIQSQIIPFKQGLYGGGRPEIQTRVLSIDVQDGSSSNILKFPPGWNRSEPHIVDSDEEFFVLEGEMEINGIIYGKHAYAHLPKGYLRKYHGTQIGSVVLTFFSEEPTIRPSNTIGAGFNPRRLVEYIDTQNMSGETGPRKHMNSGNWDPSGTVHKKLFHDPESNELTWLIGMMPGWWTSRSEVHPVVEEEFAILGDICFPVGVMRDGGYFWRPPGIEHGPFATWGGALHLCRCRGGGFSTEWKETDGPDWNPKYKPILPDEYQAYLKAAEFNHDKEPGY